MTKKAAVSRSNSKFNNYIRWLEEGGIPYEILDWEKNNFKDIKKCSSLLLTGGADIYPEFYNDWEEGKNRSGYIPERDGFEFKLLDYALDNNFPVLGICRGLQVINCKLNGSLINDIETIRGTNHKKFSDAADRIHRVSINENTLLYSVIKEKEGDVNSSHHQAIDRMGEGLVIAAKAEDGIIEGIEWAEKDDKPFFLGIQWHPERMTDKSSPFSENILQRFKEETNNN
jgi:putative glutamine amidotransferase